MKVQHIAAAALALSLGAAQAAPFATTYQGQIAASTIPGIHNGQRYTLTLMMDHGNPVADSADWEPHMLTCAIWRMNDAGNVVVAQDLLAAPPTTVQGGATAVGGNGALTQMFDAIESTNTLAAAVRALGLPPGWVVDDWYANGNTSDVFSATDPQANTQAFADAAGSVRMTPAYWSNPVPFAGNCLDAANLPGAGVASVPALGHAALALLGALVGGLGLRSQRRKDS